MEGEAKAGAKGDAKRARGKGGEGWGEGGGRSVLYALRIVRRRAGPSAAHPLPIHPPTRKQASLAALARRPGPADSHALAGAPPAATQRARRAGSCDGDGDGARGPAARGTPAAFARSSHGRQSSILPAASLARRRRSACGGRPAIGWARMAQGLFRNKRQRYRREARGRTSRTRQKTGSHRSSVPPIQPSPPPPMTAHPPIDTPLSIEAEVPPPSCGPPPGSQSARLMSYGSLSSSRLRHGACASTASCVVCE